MSESEEQQTDQPGMATTEEEFQSFLFSLIISYWQFKANKIGSDPAKIEIKQYLQELAKAFDNV